MKALSIRQPWIWAMFHLGKDVENRTWSTRIRGRVMLHASQKYDHDGAKWIEENFGIVPPDQHSLPRGGFVGSVEIVDCVEEMDSKWFFGEIGFVLKNPIEVEYRAYKGMQRFFNVRESGANNGSDS